MKRRALALAAASLLLLISAAPALATTTKILTDDTEKVTSIVPGAQIYDPLTGVASLRGEIHYGDFTATTHWPAGDTVDTGTQVGTFNYDVIVSTGVGTFWGSTELVFVAGTGFRCSYEGTLPAGTGHSVCHGYGDLRGTQTRGDFWVTLDGTASTGYLFVPGNK
jgi:hypothetical protein